MVKEGRGEQKLASLKILSWEQQKQQGDQNNQSSKENYKRRLQTPSGCHEAST